MPINIFAMIAILDNDILKFTGKSAYMIPVNSISFKSVDSATFYDDNDSKNYPVYEPYLSDVSYSYETWTKFRLKLKDIYKDQLNSLGITIKAEEPGFCYDRTYTMIKNICLWFNVPPVNNVDINIGESPAYRRPIDTQSDIAVENVISYLDEHHDFTNTIKFPLYFNGVSEIPVNQVDGAICDNFIVWQLSVLYGTRYQLDHRLFNFQIHYELY